MIPLDKQAHLWAGMAIYGLSIAILSPLYSLIPVVAIGIGKELWDSRAHSADWYDALYIIGGGTLALLWTALV